MEEWDEIKALRNAKVAHETQRSWTFKSSVSCPRGRNPMDGTAARTGTPKISGRHLERNGRTDRSRSSCGGDAESLEETERKLNAILKSYGVVDLAEIRVRQDDQQKLKT